MKKILATTAALLFTTSLTVAGTVTAADIFRGSDEGLHAASVAVVTPAKQIDKQSAQMTVSGVDTAQTLAWHQDEGNFNSGAVVFDSGYQDMSTSGLLTLSGTIRSENLLRWHSDELSAIDSVTFKNERGQSFDLAENVNSLGLSQLDGRTVEIKGTVLEHGGESVIEVRDYSIIR